MMLDNLLHALMVIGMKTTQCVKLKLCLMLEKYTAA